jgi:hypothetical protein
VLVVVLVLDGVRIPRESRGLTLFTFFPQIRRFIPVRVRIEHKNDDETIEVG